MLYLFLFKILCIWYTLSKKSEVFCIAIFLNLGNVKFISDLSNDIFVDKSMLIRYVNNNYGKSLIKFMCITRPHCIGKTMALSMLRAYHSKGCTSKELFKNK